MKNRKAELGAGQRPMPVQRPYGSLRIKAVNSTFTALTLEVSHIFVNC